MITCVRHGADRDGVRMVDFKNEDEVRRWLTGQPRDVAVILAAREALRVLPVLSVASNAASIESLGGRAVAAVLPVFRAISSSRAFVKYPGRGSGLQAAAYSAAESIDLALNNLTGIDPSVTNVLEAASSAADAVYATIYLHGATHALVSALWTAETTAACAADAQALNAGTSVRALADRPLWLDAMPDWAARHWGLLKAALLARDEDWAVWTDWYEDRLHGRRAEAKTIELGRVMLDESLWKAGPRAVNAEIRRLIEAEPAKRKRRQGEDPPPDDPPATLTQRPSSHRFDWRGGRLEATPVVEPPFDPVLAEAIRAALIEKAADLLAALTGNHADPIVSRDVQRALDLLGGRVDRIAEGILLMRSNTIAAHARAYADADSPRERAIRALLDDFSTSLGNFVDCYPGVRRINANRLELEVQAADAPAIIAEVDAVTAIARLSEAVAPSAVDALEVGREEARGLGTKIDLASGEVRAAYMEARAEVVAARVLNTTNFVSVTAQKAEAERAGIKAETLRELRKTLPKPLARGISKAAEKTITNLPDAAGIGMAYVVAGHWGALAVLVGRLAPHARKIQQIADAIDKMLRGGSEDAQSADDDP